MQRTTFLQINREGWPFLMLAAGGAFYAYVQFGVWAALPLLCLGVYLLAFFHEPNRSVPPKPLGIIAPVDGYIAGRAECRDRFLDRDAIKLSIRVAHLGAYLLRSPSEGFILEIPAGAWPKYKGQATWIRTDENDDIIFAVGKGSLLGARPCLTPYGERVGQGRRCGVRRLARRIDVYLPLNSRVEVEVGQSVHTGRDVLATLVHKVTSNDK